MPMGHISCLARNSMGPLFSRNAQESPGGQQHNLRGGKQDIRTLKVCFWLPPGWTVSCRWWRSWPGTPFSWPHCCLQAFSPRGILKAPCLYRWWHQRSLFKCREGSFFFRDEVLHGENSSRLASKDRLLNSRVINLPSYFWKLPICSLPRGKPLSSLAWTTPKSS